MVIRHMTVKDSDVKFPCVHLDSAQTLPGTLVNPHLLVSQFDICPAPNAIAIFLVRLFHSSSALGHDFQALTQMNEHDDHTVPCFGVADHVIVLKRADRLPSLLYANDERILGNWHYLCIL